jgi:cytochrome c oxidase subunit 2
MTRKTAAALCVGLGLALCAGVALADQPHPWQLGMQRPATLVTERIHAFHNELLVIISLISAFVIALLIYVMVRFNHRAHPVPTRTTHNPVIEVLWTVVPVLILVLIAIPSFKLMYYMDRVPDAAMTIKVTGHQWYWQYEYPDQGNISFNSNLVDDSKRTAEQPRLLAVDNPLVIPVGTNIRVQVAGTDVIHSWFVPSFGFQEYAVVGRLNEAWVNVEREGTYYGECNQICGVNHAFMPIEVKVLSKADFDKWLVDAKKNFSAANQPADEPGGAAATQVAAAEPSAGVQLAAAGQR